MREGKKMRVGEGECGRVVGGCKIGGGRGFIKRSRAAQERAAQEIGLGSAQVPCTRVGIWAGAPQQLMAVGCW